MKYILILSLMVSAQAHATSQIRCSATVVQWFQKIKFDYLIKLHHPTQASVTLTTTFEGQKPETRTDETDYKKAPSSQGFVYTFTEGNGYEWTVTTPDSRKGTLYYSEGLVAPCTLR